MIDEFKRAWNENRTRVILVFAEILAFYILISTNSVLKGTIIWEKLSYLFLYAPLILIPIFSSIKRKIFEYELCLPTRRACLILNRFLISYIPIIIFFLIGKLLNPNLIGLWKGLLTVTLLSIFFFTLIIYNNYFKSFALIYIILAIGAFILNFYFFGHLIFIGRGAKLNYIYYFFFLLPFIIFLIHFSDTSKYKKMVTYLSLLLFIGFHLLFYYNEMTSKSGKSFDINFLNGRLYIKKTTPLRYWKTMFYDVKDKKLQKKVFYGDCILKNKNGVIAYGNWNFIGSTGFYKKLKDQKKEKFKYGDLESPYILFYSINIDPKYLYTISNSGKELLKIDLKTLKSEMVIDSIKREGEKYKYKSYITFTDRKNNKNYIASSLAGIKELKYKDTNIILGKNQIYYIDNKNILNEAGDIIYQSENKPKLHTYYFYDGDTIKFPYNNEVFSLNIAKYQSKWKTIEGKAMERTTAMGDIIGKNYYSISKNQITINDLNGNKILSDTIDKIPQKGYFKFKLFYYDENYYFAFIKNRNVYIYRSENGKFIFYDKI